MHPVDLEQATYEIRNAALETPEGRALPFVFVVGAGISWPSVPLASDIQKHCQNVAQKNRRSGGLSPTSSLLDRYSHWFEQAYPHPGQRQRYLRALIGGKPLSPANLRLAHLLSTGKVASLVITPNFDDFLARALALLGVPHVMCDHPATTARVDLGSRDVQIVHVHGTYWFYDCCNLRGEVESRAQPSADTSSTMSSFIERALAERSPLVLGYAGWEGDVIMTALRRRLTGARLPTLLYWFCFEHAEADSLPDFLTGHQDVRVVLPPQQVPAPATSMAKGSDSKEAMTGVGQYSQSVPQSTPTDAAVLDARKVLETLLERLDVGVPRPFGDPLGFFAEHLRREVSLELGDGLSNAPYFLGDVIRRIESARTLAEEASLKTAAQTQVIARQLETVLNAVRSSQYTEAIKIAADVPIPNLSPEQRRELMDALRTAAAGSSEPQQRVRGYELVVALGDSLLKDGSGATTVEQEIAEALLGEGYALGTMERHPEAIAASDDVVRRFGDASEPALREMVAKALFYKGVRLGALGRRLEAIAAYDDVVRRVGEASEMGLREQVAKALGNKGVMLGQLGRSLEEIAAYDEVIGRFGDASEPALLRQVAKALFYKGLTLGQLDRSLEEIAAYDEVVRRFGEASEPALREQVAKALFHKGNTLKALGKRLAAIAAYHEVDRRFAGASESALREQVAKALAAKKTLLRRGSGLQREPNTAA